ncbi:uncharacterized protein LOC110409378 isoform X3 [Herrania umbratica]|uniref:Uncharacterized protein LOC110409378 isoform X3 n=1 Tax=Herrania umbratica TaxID=108875 RepID=A0A6J0ZHM2_9ROSI|nr:uncharacterized protein LOC110409378 isoform X3 [Herrania umbratica]
MPTVLEEFEPIFGEPKVEWTGSSSGSGQSSGFLFYVHSLDSSHLRIYVSDFRDTTWESVRSVLQLEDMRDSVGIGGSWSDFIHYLLASIKSEDVKLLLEAMPNSSDTKSAKLVAQKSKGMPRISFSLTKLTGSAATDAMANLSLELFKAYKGLQSLFMQDFGSGDIAQNVIVEEFQIWCCRFISTSALQASCIVWVFRGLLVRLML